MFKVEFSQDAISQIDRYISLYRESFQGLYSDTGIWSEEVIIQAYIQESKNRRNEMIDRIVGEISKDTVLGRNKDGSMLISWRTKLLFVEWNELNDSKRIISRVQIR